MIRVSGPAAFAAGERLAGPLPPARRAALRSLRATDGALLDRALVIAFPGPASATGEDLVELHVHGGHAVVAAIEASLAAMPGLAPAGPGDFTRRMLLNGRVDLTEAEALGDLLAAETEAQRRAAIDNVDGALSRRVRGWVEDLLMLSARAEAAIDFDEEEDGAALLTADTRTGMAALAAEMAEVLTNPPAERLRDGIRVVLAGPPNSGKSTLLNVLAGREAAIVSPVAGTTRDLIEVPVVRGGTAYLLIDAAGLRHEVDDPVERIGIARARAALKTADVVVWLDDDPPPAMLAEVIVAHPRCDLPERNDAAPGRLSVSAVTGQGVEELWARLAHAASRLAPALDQLVLNRRQLGLCEEARGALVRGGASDDAVLVAEELRVARSALDRVTGAASTEAMLDGLFGRFCIGK